jgi:molybdate transport system regulatory protein
LTLNNTFTSPAVERTTGGTGGGGAALTALGVDLIARYRRLEAAAASLAADDLEWLEQRADPHSTPKV